MSKIFLFDVDGVAANLTGYLIDKLAHQFKRKELPGPDDIKNHDTLFKRGSTPFTEEQLLAAYKLLASKKFAQNMLLIDGAQEGIKKVRKSGSSVFWITSPWVSSQTWDHDRRVWLEKNFHSKHQDVGFFYQKHLVRGDVFIDDKPSNVANWAAANPHGRALLFDQPWNKKDGGALERFTWDKIDQIIKEVVC